ncbi:iron-containing redox enzyme family protein [Nonomuraea sp. NPDC050536]|uniref:iron-containing redox enzyme family protein n=1 Tax=Nonomuraea sp. NPDC050536 TaxID=3364366 RepID=UPI0037CAF865
MRDSVLPGVRLRGVLELAMPSLGRLVNQMWASESPPGTYLKWLGVAHDAMRATVPLLIAAQQECARRPDTVSSLLLPYLAAQAGDEAGHDDWVREDFRQAGGDPVALEQRIPAGSIARLVGAQYYWLLHEHPVALLGHIAVLEWFPPASDLAPRLAQQYGLRLTAFTTISQHAELDQEHGDQLGRLLDALPLSPRLSALVVTSALTTVCGLADVIADLTDRRKRAPWQTFPDWKNSDSSSTSPTTSNSR